MTDREKEGRVTGRDSRRESRPDAELLLKWHAALDEWAASARGATSSVTGGGAVGVFEAEFSNRHGGRPCVTVGSGTHALVAALAAVGVGRHDEVVTSALDWPAAAQAIRILGARPVFADVDASTLTLSPAAAQTAITFRTRAVIATHLFGIPADIPGIRARCGSGIPIVEDCAQALGATLDGVAVGELGDAAAYSLGPGKHIDAGEGGVVCVPSPARRALVVGLTQHRVRRLRAGTPPGTAELLSSRLHPFAAILALHALRRIETQLASRRACAQALRLEIEPGDGSALPGWDSRREASWWRVPLLASTAPSPWSRTPIELPTGAHPGDVPVASHVLRRLWWAEPRTTPSPRERYFPRPEKQQSSGDDQRG